MKNKLVIYGAGYCGLMLSDLLLQEGNYQILCFMDQSIQKVGRQFNGIKVILPEKNKYSDKDILVIVGILEKSHLYQIIKERLYQLGYFNIIHVTDFIWKSGLYKKANLLFHVDRADLEINRNEIQTVYECLGDGCSRKTYKSILNHVIGETKETIPVFPIKEQYFAYDIYKQIETETFIDCGAFRGDILKYFLHNNKNKFKKYVAIEPDPANSCRILEDDENRKNPKILIIKKAITNKKGTVFLRNYFNENSVITLDGDILAESETLENVIIDHSLEPSFVKVDIEGYEKELLLGSEKILLKYNPVMAIAIYHKAEDLWKIPLWFIQRFPENKFYIRSYLGIQETVFYSVSKNRSL